MTVITAFQPPVNMSKRWKSSEYPKPLIVPPTLEHKQTIILLHGRGSNANKFGSEIIATEIPNFGRLPAAFPSAKIVFPTASKRRAAVLKGKSFNQWFDSWSLDTYAEGEREDLQYDGLRETSAYIHRLLREEIALVGANNVVLGGLSQGCGAILISLLMWDGEPIAAAWGMCGFLPLRAQLEEILQNHCDDNEDDNPFSRSDEYNNDSEETDSGVSPADLLLRKALAFLREELDIPASSMPMAFQRIPLFLGHGVEDQKVAVNFGREAASCLRNMAMDVHLKEYELLGHWYSKEMLHDMVKFSCNRPGWGAD